MRSSLNRRHFLHSSTAAGIGVLAAPHAGRADDLVTVSIFYTTDLHGHILPTESYAGWKDVGGLARCATQIQRWRAENPNSLLIDIGDVYQGTHVSKQSGGALMISLLNKLKYDAWVIGNHEFDWGLEALANAVDQSDMPVLSSNAQLGDRAAWDAAAGDASPLNKIRPYVMREVAGFRIAIIGATTPGLSAWLHPKLLQNFSAIEPALTVKNAVAEARTDGAHCVVIAGHMGLKNDKDDYANPVRAIIDAVEADVFIAGHTHQDMASVSLNNTLYTQANYYGIHAGRLDLTFSRSATKLVQKRAFTVLMDGRFDLDPVVLDHTRKELDTSTAALTARVGTLKDAMTTERPSRTEPSAIHRLIGSAIKHALAQRDVAIDAVFHGTFSEEGLAAGAATLANLWTVIPYENMLVTAELSQAEISQVVEEETQASFSSRVLMGLPPPAPANSEKRHVVAFNAYDAQSGGRRLNRLKEILDSPAAKTQFHKVESREALIVYLRSADKVGIDNLLI